MESRLLIANEILYPHQKSFHVYILRTVNRLHLKNKNQIMLSNSATFFKQDIHKPTMLEIFIHALVSL